MHVRFEHTLVWIVLLLGGPALLAGCTRARSSEAPAPMDEAPYVQASDPIEAGRYLVTVGGCNDCHTPGYLETEGNVPEADWLIGSPIGWRGPWGTTYPANLRWTVQHISEDAFVTMLHTRKALPPMPWMNVANLSDQDARAIYQYIRSLGPKGEPAHAAVPPDQEPSTPYLNLVPLHLDRLPAVPSAQAGTPQKDP